MITLYSFRLPLTSDIDLLVTGYANYIIIIKNANVNKYPDLFFRLCSSITVRISSRNFTKAALVEYPKVC